jgi:tetrathionate reductase subunit B
MTENSRRPVVNRRKFLKSSAATGVAAAATLASAPVGAAATPTPTPRKRYGMLIDARRCYGVHACSVACKAENGVPLGQTRSWVEYIEKGTYPNVTRSFLPRLCNHCEKPACVSVCPTGATWKRKEDGIVVVDDDICIGCKYCVHACPYDARYLNPITGTVDKCDFCIHRVSQGLEPACVEACPSRARIFGDLNDPESEISKKIARYPVTVLRPEKGTQPNVFYIAADHTDERAPTVPNQYVRVETHRRQLERR